MADVNPLKLVDLGSGEGELREFAAGDTVPVSQGGTGAADGPSALANLGLSDTDDLSEGTSNLWFTAARVRAAVLTGLSTATNAAIAATDTVLQAFGKLQAQVTSKADKDIPAFRARRTTDDLGIASGVGRTVIFNSEDFDHGAGYNTANGRFAPSVAGVYLVTATVYVRSSVINALASVNVRLEKNGAEVARGSNLQFVSSPTDASVDVQTLVEMDGVSDYVTVVATGSVNSGTLGIIAGGSSTVTHFSGYLVRAA